MHRICEHAAIPQLIGETARIEAADHGALDELQGTTDTPTSGLKPPCPKGRVGPNPTPGTAFTTLAEKTVANTHVVLHKAMVDAVRLGLLDHNVVAAVSPPRVPGPQLSVWTVDQLRDLLTVASSHRLSAAFVLLATTGMRCSEVLGLRWADIDFDDGSVSIIRSLTVVDARPIVTASKTAASRRLVYLDANRRCTAGASRLINGLAGRLRVPISRRSTSEPGLVEQHLRSARRP